MGEFANQSLKFESDAVSENTLILTRLVGEERISGLFRFELELVSAKPDINLEAVLYEPARIGLETRVGDNQKSFRWYDGVLESFQELEQGQGWTTYRAVMVPDLWKLTEFYRSRIYMDHTVDSMMTELLKDELGLQHGQDFEFKLSRVTDSDDPKERAIYPWREYVVQFEETDYDFLARWLEHEGIFFFFENDGTKEKVVFADATSVYKPVAIGHDAFPYRPQGRSQSTGSTQDGGQAQEVLSLHCTLTRQPKSVSLNDYNWRDPSVRLGTNREVHKKGSGLQNEYNDHYKTPDQGKALADVRAEEWQCRAAVFRGLSTCRSFRPGRTFELQEHFRDDFNQPYLLVSVAHEAEQSINLEASTVTGANYQNTFEAIPADLPFRPERLTDWPAIRGVINARIESENEGDILAHLDEHGRYKVRFPFDDNAHGDAKKDPGKASRWVRMAQPYAGADAGMHFPLVEGTEVLITHIDGDPDRPVISGAVPNPETTSPTDQHNPTLNRMRSAGGSTLTMDDDLGTPGFVMFDQTASHVEDLRFRLGGRRDEPAPAGGGGGANGGQRASMFPRPRRKGAPLPGAGSGGKVHDQGGSVDSGDTDNNPDTPDVKTLQAAFDALVDGDALHDLGASGRYVDPAGATTWIEWLRRYWAGEATWDELSAGWEGIEPLKMGEAAISRETITAALDKILAKHQSGMTDTSKLLEAGMKFMGSAYGSRLRMNLGDDHVLQVGNTYAYADVSYAASYGTGGDSWHYEDGDTDDHSEQHGDATSKNELYGSSDSTTWQNGKATSKSTLLADSDSESFVQGNSTSSSIVLGAVAGSSIHLGDDASSSIFVGAKQSVDIHAAQKDSLTIGLAAQNSISLVAAGVTDLSLRLGDTATTSLYIGNMADISVVLASKGAINLTLAAEDTLNLVLAARNTNEIVLAVDTRQYLTAGIFANTGVFIGGKIDTELALGLILDTQIAGAAIIETKIAAAKSQITLSSTVDEIDLSKTDTRLNGVETKLGKSICSLLSKLGI